jgi:hypothetical protein
MGNSRTKLSMARIGRSERAGRVLDLRKSGLTFREIGTRMGFSEQRAHALVTQELARLNAKRSESAEEVTRLEVERLDALLAAVWGKAMEGELSAVATALAIAARRAKLLGLDVEKPGADMVTVPQAMIFVNAILAAAREVVQDPEDFRRLRMRVNELVPCNGDVVEARRLLPPTGRRVGEGGSPKGGPAAVGAHGGPER